MKTIRFFGFFLALSFLYNPSAFSADKNPEPATAEEKLEKGTVEKKILETLMSRKTITKEKYITSGVVSIFPGFGLGHIIQGRHQEAWKFSAMEFASLSALFVLVPASSIVGQSIPYNMNELVWWVLVSGSALSFVGFKAWEIADAWKLPSNYKIVKEASVSLTPLVNLAENKSLNLGLSLSYKF